MSWASVLGWLLMGGTSTCVAVLVVRGQYACSFGGGWERCGLLVGSWVARCWVLREQAVSCFFWWPALSGASGRGRAPGWGVWSWSAGPGWGRVRTGLSVELSPAAAAAVRWWCGCGVGVGAGVGSGSPVA
jgi:hypothetical protein